MENNEMKENELPSSLENETRRKAIFYLVQYIHTVCQQRHLSVKAFTETVSIGAVIREHFMTKNEQKYYDELLLTWKLDTK
jgi:hypothetical protein